MGRFKVTVTNLDEGKDQPSAAIQTVCASGPALLRPAQTSRALQTVCTAGPTLVRPAPSQTP
jgi:hypothetical protein